MASPLLQLEHVTKRFGRVVIAEDLSLTVEAGETVGIVGPNGAGKTSLFGLISGDLAPGAGEIRFAGRTVTRLDAAARCRLGIGRTYQVPRPFGDMTVFENVLVAAQQGGGLRRGAASRRPSRHWSGRACPARRTCPPSGSACCSASGLNWRGRWPRSLHCCCWTRWLAVSPTPRSHSWSRSSAASTPRERR